MTLDETVHHDVTFGGLVGDNARIGGNVTILPGAIVGDGVTVESGTTVRERIEDGAVVRRG
ncbi:hypothetical protein BG842_04380 [Haladaptatus sp. W1]|uniref:DapH/DapD/GlmU-related protein n=1 Tax=Haladaptatus sp. W1 TaxID=1897478 RepID=UPI00084975C8|nr:DapH/DapD/GlmU-related protein [Haladaptatus sp. W1]ODR79935.1 hypothetical protein BG842_04380 [Haladaptatus sp. W1]